MPGATSVVRSIARVPAPPTPARQWAGRLLDILFPPRCGGCQRVGSFWCPGCAAAVQALPLPICRRCGLPIARGTLCHGCRASLNYPVIIRSVGLYAAPLSSAIQQLKYDGVMAIAEPLGQLLAGYWQPQGLAMDLVVPVPLHGRRLRERGFNQARLLAVAFCCRAGLPLVQEGMLRRDRDTPQQVKLGPEERRHNMTGAFAWHGPPLPGVRALLIDDVATTGATLAACAQALREAGARRIWALTVARAIS